MQGRMAETSKTVYVSMSSDIDYGTGVMETQGWAARAVQCTFGARPVTTEKKLKSLAELISRQSDIA